MAQKKTPPPLNPMGPILWLVILGSLIALNLYMQRPTKPEPRPYSELLDLIRRDGVTQVELRNDEIIAVLAETPEGKTGARITASRLPRFDEAKLLEALEEHNVEYSGKIESQNPLWSVALGSILPFLLIIGIYFLIFRRLVRNMAGGASGPLSFGKNRAKVYDESKSIKVTFADVAGIEESVLEMREVVDFLRNPKRYQALGAKIPKGVLLVGPPGTGKTLLARAVAGESNTPFFSISGSDFVEMFMGVGASRVRDLFGQAMARSPCIIFIDEIDAIGKSRGGFAALSTNDEREQTLNQLLAEMDGFDARAGIVIMAATNRPEVLDPALVRAGRFDRQVVVDRPSVGGREAILQVHVRDLQLGDDVNLNVVARRTPGMVGADLARVANEAALAAARRHSDIIEQRDFEESVDRIQLGLKKQGRAMTEEEKRRVAFHESGHALVAMSVEHADPVHRITIIPRSIGALGVTLQLPTEERYLMLKNELLDQIAVMLGGRVAEQVALGEISTGAQNDLERATETARQMVCRFGMSENLGPVTFGQPTAARFLDTPFLTGDKRNYSEETARAIDAEVRAIVDHQQMRARAILEARRALLLAMVERLLAVETLDHADLEALMKDAPKLPAPETQGPETQGPGPARPAGREDAPPPPPTG